jgi:hypothetical protein
MSKVTILGDTSGKIELVAANTISPNIAFILPSADGSAGQVLATDGSGTLSFVTNDGTASFQAANSAGAYANAAFAAANSAAASSVDSTARAVANSLFDGTAEANVSSLIVQEGGTVTCDSFNSLDGEGSGFLNLRANDTRLGNDGGNVQFNAQSYYVTLANTDGTLTVPGNISGANTITANNLVGVNVISSNTVTANNLTVTGILNVDGVVLQWHTPVPLTSKGDPGDVAGLISIDNDKIYRCVGTYDGTTDIWRYINFTGGTWG